MMKLILSPFLLLFISMLCVAGDKTTVPALLLAKSYESPVQLKNYWVSEKLDGIRAYWDGKVLLSRGGNVFNAPNWFLNSLPTIALDGELWIARGSFEQVSSIVRRKKGDSHNWRKIKYMVFDLPNHPGDFDQRLIKMKEIIGKISLPYLQVVEQYKISDNKTLISHLEYIVKLGGEGLMLHAAKSHYRSGRHSDLLKLKKYSDAEAIVIQHFPGKGKYHAMLGAMLVETPEKIQFKIGSGFSDLERKYPPPIGSTITYKYTGFSKNGVPRFASYLRMKISH